MATLQPGDRVERYVIEAPLGQGGMGRVYRAHDERLDRRVALKVLLAEGEDQEGRARLLREARAAAALDHPNVVHVYDVGEADGSPYIAMELVLGKSLRTLIGDGSVPFGERVRALTEIALALAAAHDAGLVHRDVKPENVIVRSDGRVKVLDFGIARKSRLQTDPTAPTEAHLATLTAEGVKVGTPLYMAPEQIRGDGVDGKTDQFAWGVVAFELLAGRPPWNASDAMALMASILTDEPKALGDDVPRHVSDAVRRTLSKRPSERFGSMKELVAALSTEGEEAVVSPLKDRSGRASSPAQQAQAPQRPSSWPTQSSAAPWGQGQQGSWPPAHSLGFAGAHPPASPYMGQHHAPPPPPMLSRRYSPKELEEILDRALALQPTGYRYEEIAAAAREVGVDEPTLAVAMRDLVKRGAVEEPESERLRRRNRFYRHAGVWGAFVMFFFLLNLFSNLDGHGRVEWWFQFPSVVWGVIVAVHAVFYYFPTPKPSPPRAARSADPRIDYDARMMSSLLQTRMPRMRVDAPPARAMTAREVIDVQADVEAQAEAEASSPRRVRQSP